MGRSKKKTAEESGGGPKPFCYFCDRDFENEDMLVRHQLGKHFSCPECAVGSNRGRCEGIHGLVGHMMKVHRRECKEVPNSIPGRGDLQTCLDLNIFGMSGVPEEMLRERGLLSTPTAPLLPPPVPRLPAAQQTGQSPLVPRGLHLDPPSLPMPAMMPPPSAPSSAHVEVAKPASKGTSEQNWKQAAAEWMAQKQVQEEEERIAAQIAAEQMPPPLPEMDGFSQPMDGFSQPLPADNGLFPPNHLLLVPPMSQSFQPTPGEGSQLDRATVAEVAEAARLASAMAAETRVQKDVERNNAEKFSNKEEKAELLPHKLMRPMSRILIGPMSSTSMLRERQASKSRSRTPPRRDYKARSPSPRSRKVEPQEGRTIEITGGVSQAVTRIWMKKEMEKFGRVEVCHTGNKQNLQGEPPWVRFVTTSSAAAALAAINEGKVFLEGRKLEAKVKSDGKPRLPPRLDSERTSRDIADDDHRRRPARRPPPKDNLAVSSRDLMMADRRRRRRSSSSSRSPRRRR